MPRKIFQFRKTFCAYCALLNAVLPLNADDIKSLSVFLAVITYAILICKFVRVTM